MQRMHLIELHEQPWMPPSLREGLTDLLEIFARGFDTYRHALAPLAEALDETGAEQVVDLCSGSGGPWPHLIERVQAISGRPERVVLTDLFPHPAVWREVARATGGHVVSRDEPVDATDLPADLRGFRTLFASFHHFRPTLARAILQDAVDKGDGIAVFELTERSPQAMAAMLGIPALTWLTAPLTRPFKASRLLWTYLLPALPVIATFDGLVSCLRTYSADDLLALTRALEGRPYRWRVGQARAGRAPLKVSWLIGTPA